MSDPCAELQPAIRSALKADASLQAIVGPVVKVYDIPPVNASAPYLTIGDDSVTPDLAECLDGAEVRATVDVWSLTSPPGKLEAKRIGAAVQAVLLALEGSSLPSFRIVTVLPALVRYLADTDGRTVHGVIAVSVFLEPL